MSQLPLAALHGKPSNVEQLLFLATHSLAGYDLRLARHMSRQLRGAKLPAGEGTMRLWALVYAERDPRTHIEINSSLSAQIEAAACVWGDRSLRLALPKLGAAMRSDPALKSTPNSNHRRYFWFHSSLLLWHMRFGRHYPRLRYLWRTEPDVLFAGPWPNLLQIVAKKSSADLVLPQFSDFVTDQKRRPGNRYPHWERNSAFLLGIPPSERVYSLVSIGRYSRRFVLDIMAPLWRAGSIGYEELFLPAACLNEQRARGPDACQLASLRRMQTSHKVGGRTALTAHFRYRPFWSCNEFRANASSGLGGSGAGEIWHPVKDRGCWVKYLGGCPRAGSVLAADCGRRRFST